MRPSRASLFFIILLTLAAIFINIPREFQFRLQTPTLPIINRSLGIDKTLYGKNPLYRLPFFQVRDLDFRRGLDLEGGTSITLRGDMKGIKEEDRNDALDSAKGVIERRINFFGVAEPLIQTAKVNDDYRIIVEIPGVTDVNEAVRLVGTTAKLSFWESGASPSADPDLIGAEASPSANLPLGTVELLGPNPKETNLSGSDLDQTAVTFDPNTGQPQIELMFNSEGAKKFAEITKRNVGKILAIVLDDQVIEAPRVNETITGGSARISGSFTTSQANALRAQLVAGALPIPLSILEQEAIGATLGSESLQKSLFAGGLGLVVIVVFMCALYGRLGFIASLALLVYTLLILAIFRLSTLTPYAITLTLAGIAGVILSIGIAVDANILIFERMKEEMRRGRTPQMAMDLGFSRAWASIRDSNIASLITSAVLFWLGTGVVRGFALTLAIGVLVSMFSAITVTRTLLRYLYKK